MKIGKIHLLMIAACGIAVAGKPAYKLVAPYAERYKDIQVYDKRYQRLIGFGGVCGAIDSPNRNVPVCVDSLEKFRDDVSAYRKTIDTLEYTIGMKWHKSGDVYYESHDCYAAAEKAAELMEAFNAACQVVVCQDRVINETKKAKREYEACVKKNGSPFELAEKIEALAWLHNTADDMIPELQRPVIVGAKIGKGVSLGAAIAASMNDNMSPEEKAEYGIVPLRSLRAEPSPADLEYAKLREGETDSAYCKRIVSYTRSSNYANYGYQSKEDCLQSFWTVGDYCKEKTSYKTRMDNHRYCVEKGVWNVSRREYLSEKEADFYCRDNYGSPDKSYQECLKEQKQKTGKGKNDFFYRDGKSARVNVEDKAYQALVAEYNTRKKAKDEEKAKEAAKRDSQAKAMTTISTVIGTAAGVAVVGILVYVVTTGGAR
jgi:hypothetical protein